jgi:hypothetical protein
VQPDDGHSPIGYPSLKKLDVGQQCQVPPLRPEYVLFTYAITGKRSPLVLPKKNSSQALLLMLDFNDKLLAGPHVKDTRERNLALAVLLQPAGFYRSV